jgi:hypothetical protein
MKSNEALEIRPSPGGLTDSPDADAGGLNGLTGLEEATTAEADTSCGPGTTRTITIHLT